VTRIVIAPSARTITGYEEDLRLSVLYVRTGVVRDIGGASRPEWSGSGAYLSYWREDGKLYVNLGGAIVARIEASQPAVRWDGDTLYYWYDDEIQAWHAGDSWTVAHLDPELAIQYPRDDAYFSADATRFTVTRYSLDGATERYVGSTRSGATARVNDPDVTFTEWSPKGDTLLLRTNDRIVLRESNGATRTADLAAFAGRVHGWTADGRVLVGSVSATVPGGNAIDRFSVWDPFNESDKDVAELPNLLGARSFSPDGSYFVGVARSGLYATQLELFRCGVAGGQGLDRADPAARSRQARIEQDARRFVRPVAGEVTQFLQGAHTGIDIAAPFGSVIVAADDGVVDAVGWVQVGGRRVCVQHADAIESCYYHTSAALAQIGQRVSRGQPIALVGMTGATTGPHVHWEVKRDERIVDPLGL
jgi:murein DD-endopeptidase MepM/ murein hydrolase activator NlpD